MSSYTDLYIKKHGSGVHSGVAGSASLTIHNIPENMESVAYTKDNLYRDLVTRTIPEVREERTQVVDIITSMSQHNDRYMNKSLAQKGRPYISHETPHLKR